MKPKMTKVYSIHDLQNLKPDVDGIVHVDGGIMGPNGKWWIDEEGNAYFGGEMTVMKDVDPAFIQLVSTASAPTGIQNRSLWIKSNVLKYRDDGGVDVSVPVGSTPTPPTLISDINNNTDPGASLTTTESTQNTLSITPTTNGASIYISAYWTGSDEDVTNGAGHVPTVKLKRSSTILDTYTTFTANTGGDNSFFCGAMFYVDSPATTSATTYNLTFQAPSGAVNYLLHSSLVVFECFPAIE